MLQTIIKDICGIHAAILYYRYILDIVENISSIFLLPRPGMKPAFLHCWCRRRLLIVQRLPYGFLASFLLLLASFFLDDDVDGAPIRCQR